MLLCEYEKILHQSHTAFTRGPDPTYLYQELVTIGISFTRVWWGPDLLRAGPDPLGPLAGHDSHNFQDGPERSGTL